MIISLLRAPTSYFRAYRSYFVAIYVSFFAFPTREFVLFFYPDETPLRYMSQIMVGAAVAIAVVWGYLATRLYHHPEAFSFRSVIKEPGRIIHFAFFVYLTTMAVVVAAVILVPDAVLVDPGRTALYPLSGGIHRAIAYGPSFLAVAGASLIIAFTCYPLIVLVALRSQLRDREVRRALKVIASSFGATSIVLLALNALATFGYSVLGLAHLLSVSLMINVVHVFRNQTFLKAFLGVVPSLEPLSVSKRPNQMVLIYGNQDEKFVPISRYISEAVNKQARVLYFHHEDEAIVREGLAKNGVSPRQHMLKGSLRLFPLGSLYQSEGIMDEEAAIESCQEFASETKALGKESLKIIIDYGEYTKRPSQKFVEHLTDKRWTGPDNYVSVLMAFADTAFQGQENTLRLLRSRVEVLDLSESMDMFSRTMGLTHQAITGKKILFEYDPLSDYERVLSSLLAESKSNFERTIIFTRKDSPIHSFVGEQSWLKVFVLTSRVSYPRVETENRVLLPAYDSSLLLDALNKTIEAYAGASFTIIFDGISHYVYTLGADRAHSLVRQALELMISNKITAVFLLNVGAHDQKTASMFENLFDMEMLCLQGTRAPEVRKRLSLTPTQ